MWSQTLDFQTCTVIWYPLSVSLVAVLCSSRWLGWSCFVHPSVSRLSSMSLCASPPSSSNSTTHAFHRPSSSTTTACPSSSARSEHTVTSLWDLKGPNSTLVTFTFCLSSPLIMLCKGSNYHNLVLPSPVPPFLCTLPFKSLWLFRFFCFWNSLILTKAALIWSKMQ